MNNSSIQSISSAGMNARPTEISSHKNQSEFGEMLRKSIDSVNSNLQEAETIAAGLAGGQHANIHETMIAMEKASISFRMLTKIQNKVVEAYKEIMRIQV